MLTFRSKKVDIFLVWTAILSIIKMLMYLFNIFITSYINWSSKYSYQLQSIITMSLWIPRAFQLAAYFTITIYGFNFWVIFFVWTVCQPMDSDACSSDYLTQSWLQKIWNDSFPSGTCNQRNVTNSTKIRTLISCSQTSRDLHIQKFEIMENICLEKIIKKKRKENFKKGHLKT